MSVRRYRLSPVCHPTKVSRLTLLEPSKLFEKVACHPKLAQYPGERRAGMQVHLRSAGDLYAELRRTTFARRVACQP